MFVRDEHGIITGFPFEHAKRSVAAKTGEIIPSLFRSPTAVVSMMGRKKLRQRQQNKKMPGRPFQFHPESFLVHRPDAHAGKGIYPPRAVCFSILNKIK